MSGYKRKELFAGLVGTALLHGLLLLVLWLVCIRASVHQEEGGVSVQLGSELLAQGQDEAFDLTEVDVIPVASEDVSIEEPTSVDRELLIQEEEETVTLEEKKQEKEQFDHQENEPVEEEIKPREQTEEEKREEAKRKAAATASRSVAGAFGKSASLADRGVAEQGNGVQGVPTGNDKKGAVVGQGMGNGFDLDGRSLLGRLPEPRYTVQDEGIVVVAITVNSVGRVVSANVRLKGTTTTNPAFYKAAVDAAYQARFNEVQGVDDQSGTITYYFNLK